MRTQTAARSQQLNEQQMMRDMALGAAGYAGGVTTARGEDASAIQFGMRHAF